MTVYAKFLDIPDWKNLQNDLINFRYNHSRPDQLWWCHSEDEVKEKVPSVYNTFEAMGLKLRQLIFFDNLNNDLKITDPTDPRCLFIHTDSSDDKESKGTNLPNEIEYSTNFQPRWAINIPLENYKGSQTLWYELLDENINQVLYSAYDCGGHDPKNCREVFRFELTQPAVLAIDKPHAVYNPNKGIRSVATFRFYNDIEFLVKKKPGPEPGQCVTS